MTEQENEVTAQVAETPSADSNQVIIEVQNPTTEEMAGISEHIKVNYDFKVIVKPVSFNFKKSTDKLSGIETVRKAVELAVPYPSMDGIVDILETGGKGLELLVEAMETVVNNAARDILSEGPEGFKLTAADFPVNKLSWDFISKLPKAQRRGGGIPKEVWEAFAADYVAIMPEVTGKKLDQVANAAKLLANKLASVKTNEPVLQLLVGQLAIYADNSPNAEEFQDCIAFLLEKADTFLNVTPEQLLAAL